MDASVIGYNWDADGGIGVNGKDADDKVVVDPVELEPAGSPTARAPPGRTDETRSALARGTREHVPFPHSPVASASRSEGPCDLERDPIAVLRAWPHSMSGRDASPERTRAAPAPSRAQRRIEDKIVLAHFALDLYREIDELEDIVQHTGATPCESGPAACSDPRCAARTDVVRGALVEACLLVQRVAMMPTERVDIEDRIYELLQLLRR
jgi:hypothetical protein